MPHKLPPDGGLLIVLGTLAPNILAPDGGKTYLRQMGAKNILAPVDGKKNHLGTKSLYSLTIQLLSL